LCSKKRCRVKTSVNAKKKKSKAHVDFSLLWEREEQEQPAKAKHQKNLVKGGTEKAIVGTKENGGFR